ncbi:hypothetical protein Tsubulata_034359 [Turnera subulata]|uniref:E2 ubiquitin-conjugating enzyme n=1 Tax=Turnera subulata TaxID=218843 RepID=A0A9Q0J8I5_9ROSI|nr:hypothetical protein Tsubulata_034359 [Turnera subulata]
MAQAARLSLRMHKELKLLLADPPPGASFPLLSADSDLSSSLTTIDADIEGPEGTVYDKGVFRVKIQIPERYPFQPPSVTFSTPIYHPNIDTGGRICLDILNLPPKGAWQPSLNVSTVLTSIRLLLSEPNPDDGLMCEASREYKYNRQVFDQKARAMTEKYAKDGAAGHSCGTWGIQTDLDSSTVVEGKGPDIGSNHEVNAVSNQCKPRGFCRKLSLESSSATNTGRSNVEMNDEPGLGVEVEVVGSVLRDMPNTKDRKYEKPSGTCRKLSLQSSVQFHNEDHRNTADKGPIPSAEDVGSKQSAGALGVQVNNCYKQQLHEHHEKEPMCGSKMITSKEGTGKTLSNSYDLHQSSDGNDNKLLVTSESSPGILSDTNSEEISKCAVDRMWSIATGTKCKKVLSLNKKLSLGSKVQPEVHEKDDKENLVPAQKLPFSSLHTPRETGIGRKLTSGPLINLQGNKEDDSQMNLRHKNISPDPSKKQKCNKAKNGMQVIELAEDPPIAESVIVLDSEESEEETTTGSLRSKLSLGRKRIAKRKTQA